MTTNKHSSKKTLIKRLTPPHPTAPKTRIYEFFDEKGNSQGFGVQYSKSPNNYK